jgi:IS30 family transposase
LIGLARGESLTTIADRIGKAPSTVSREVSANGGRHDYRAWGGHLRAQEQARRPKPAKMASCPLLLAQVVEGLEQLWSPEEISRRLRLEHPDDPMMQVSPQSPPSVSAAGGTWYGSPPTPPLRILSSGSG